ncbi:MAG: hypothetical protein ACOCWC_04470 [Bacteroidota bacterium]
MNKGISRFEKHGFLIWNLSFVLNIIWVFLIFFSLDDKQLYVYFNSDTLYLPSIFKDVFIDRTGFQGWSLNAAPNFFPDMFFYFIFNGIFHDFKTAMIVFSTFQYATLLFLLNLVFKEISKNISWNYLALGNMIMILIFFVTSVSGDFSFTFYILSISYHIGPFIMTLICLFQLIKYLKTQKNKHLYLLFVLGFLAVLSNRLFIVMFVFPSLSLVLLLSKKDLRKRILLFFVTAAAFTTLGIITFNLLKSSNYIYIAGTDWKMFNFSNIIQSFYIMASQHLRYVYLMDFRGIIVILSLISFFLMGYVGINYLHRLFIMKEKGYNWLKAFFVFYFIAFFLIVLFMPVINGSYVGVAILRYNIHVFYFALFNYVFLAYYFIRDNKKSGSFIFKYLVTVGMIIIISYTLYYPLKSINRISPSTYFNYYPDYIACADKIALENNLKYGVSEYWLAKKITMFSKQDLRVYTVYPNMKIWYHVMNRNWYYKNGKGKYGNPEFRFVIPNSLNEAAIIKQLGKPLEKLDCSGTFKMWKYPEFGFDRKTRFPSLIKKAQD